MLCTTETLKNWIILQLRQRTVKNQSLWGAKHIILKKEH